MHEASRVRAVLLSRLAIIRKTLVVLHHLVARSLMKGPRRRCLTMVGLVGLANSIGLRNIHGRRGTHKAS